MNLFNKVTAFAFLSLSTPLWATPGVYEINSACLDVGCFSGDNPNTRTVEINKTSGTFRLTSDLKIDALGISVSTALLPQFITIDLNGFQIEYTGFDPSTNGINITGVNSFIAIKNGSITNFNNGIDAGNGVSVKVDNMIFRLMKNSAILAPIGRITDSTFDCNFRGIHALDSTGSFEGDRLYLENNVFSCGLISTRDPIFSFGETNVCKNNRIIYDAGSNNQFGLCVLVETNICNDVICNQLQAGDNVNEITE